MLTASDFEETYLRDIQAVIKPLFMQWKQAMVASDILLWATAVKFHGVRMEDFQAAAMYWSISQKFMPQPIEIMELAKGENSGNRAQRALNTLQELIETYGPYRGEPKIDDPVLLQTIEDLGGWKQLNEDCDNSERFRTQFQITYRNNQKSTPVLGSSNRLGFKSSHDEQAHLSFDEGPSSPNKP